MFLIVLLLWQVWGWSWMLHCELNRQPDATLLLSAVNLSAISFCVVYQWAWTSAC